jgi:hypothetical protein
MQELDVVYLLRRLRIHGLCLSELLENDKRKAIMDDNKMRAIQIA